MVIRMGSTHYFPFFNSTIRKLTGRSARRIYFVIILVLLCLTTAARVRSYLMARKIQAILQQMAEIRVDQTNEEQLLKMMPYLTRSQQDWKNGQIVQRWYYTEVSNESDWLMPRLMDDSRFRSMIGRNPDWLRRLAYNFGYRYMQFDANVLVQDGRVSQVRYGLSKEGIQPRAVGYIVSVASVHGFWLPYQSGFGVTSEEDMSPQYRPGGDERSLVVTYTNDAPPN